MQAPKNGFFYVLDRETGKLISAQPFSTVNWASSIDLATGRPVENPAARYADTDKPWFAMPGPYGAHNWQPMSFSPQTKLVYIPAHDVPFNYANDPRYAVNPVAYNTGVDILQASTPTDPAGKAQLMAMVRGFLKAWDPIAQKEVWRIEQPGAWNSGVLSTGGGLVFAGNAAGDFNAFSASKGQKLWTFHTQTGLIAAPMTYMVGDQQYVAIVAGWGGVYALSAGVASHKGTLPENRSRVLAFKLGGSAKLPAVSKAETHDKPPAAFGDANVLGLGMALYQGYCSVCHGEGAVAGGVLPDLRWSAMLGSSEAFRKPIIEGSRSKRGMPNFSQVVTPEFAEAIRAYVVKRANETHPDTAAAAAPTVAPAAAAPAAATPAAAPAAGPAAAPKQ
jgi:alcohol dehydrogenase (cytochrome c)/quinohemoprotein ethanol dehydrogenase